MTLSRQVRVTLLAFLCFPISWYYFAKIAPPAMLAVGRVLIPRSDLYVPWYGAREILHGRNPYSPQVTAAIQIAVYGATVGPEYDQQRFAYPAFSALVFLPFALFTFTTAHKLALFLFLISAAVASRCWLDSWSYFLAAFLFLSASYPFLEALLILQPTLLFLGLLSLAVWAVRSHRYVLAGVTLALATSKPQLAISVALPLAIWGTCDFRVRKRFLLSFGAALSALLVASEMFVPGWIPQWLAALRGYVQNTSVTPLLTEQLTQGGSMAGAVSGVLAVSGIAAVALVAWSQRRGEPTLAVCFSIVVFQMVIPGHPYDLVLQVAPVLWLATHNTKVNASGWAPSLALTAVWVTLALCWIFTCLLSILHLFAPALAVSLGLFPIRLFHVLPFMTLTVFALCSWRYPRAWNAHAAAGMP